jgi:hypothetical protein
MRARERGAGTEEDGPASPGESGLPWSLPAEIGPDELIEERKASPSRFELLTCGLGNRRSIQLSYGDVIFLECEQAETQELDPWSRSRRAKFPKAWVVFQGFLGQRSLATPPFEGQAERDWRDHPGGWRRCQVGAGADCWVTTAGHWGLATKRRCAAGLVAVREGRIGEQVSRESE